MGGGAFCKDSIRAHEGSLGFMVGFVATKTMRTRKPLTAGSAPAQALERGGHARAAGRPAGLDCFE